MIRLARFWKRWASSGSMPRWWHWTCACVQARVTVRSKVARSRYLSARAAAVGLVLGASAELPLDDDGVGGPDGRLRRRPNPARGQQAAQVGQRLGLDEEVGEGRVGVVRGRRSQHELAVGRYLELARLEPEIRDRDPADLGVVLGGDEHLERGRDRAVATMELRPVLGEGH